MESKDRIQICFVIGDDLFAVSFFGHMFNGFGYVTNRWIWGYCFVISLIVVEMFPDMMKLPVAGKWAVVGITVLSAVPTFYFRSGGGKRKAIVCDRGACIIFCTACGYCLGGKIL